LYVHEFDFRERNKTAKHYPVFEMYVYSLPTAGSLELKRGREGREREGNTEEENNGYVVFKLNIHGSAGEYIFRVIISGECVTPRASNFLY
jgi:hypothetical protein